MNFQLDFTEYTAAKPSKTFITVEDYCNSSAAKNAKRIYTQDTYNNIVSVTKINAENYNYAIRLVTGMRFDVTAKHCIRIEWGY